MNKIVKISYNNKSHIITETLYGFTINRMEGGSLEFVTKSDCFGDSEDSDIKAFIYQQYYKPLLINTVDFNDVKLEAFNPQTNTFEKWDYES